MKYTVKLNGKIFKIKPFKTKDELDFLEYLYVHDELDDDEINTFIDDLLSKYVEPYFYELSDPEKLILLLKLREITVGDEIKLKYTCPCCNKPLDGKFSTEHVLSPAKYSNSKIHGLFDKKINIDINNILTVDEIDELDLDEFERLKNNINDYVDIYDFDISSNCIYCKNKNYLTLTKKNIIAFISEENFMSLSKIIHALTYYDNITRSDVLEMTPLQRIVEVGNLEQTKKEIQKLKKESQKR